MNSVSRVMANSYNVWFFLEHLWVLVSLVGTDGNHCTLYQEPGNDEEEAGVGEDGPRSRAQIARTRVAAICGWDGERGRAVADGEVQD